MVTKETTLGLAGDAEPTPLGGELGTKSLDLGRGRVVRKTGIPKGTKSGQIGKTKICLRLVRTVVIRVRDRRRLGDRRWLGGVSEHAVLARASKPVLAKRHLDLLLLRHLQIHRLTDHHPSGYCSEDFSDFID